MRLTLLVFVAFATLPAQAAEGKIKLAAPSLSYANLSKEMGDAALDRYARAMDPLGVRVVTANEVSALLGQERQKQILGCPNEQATECVMELAGALGVDGTVTGSLGKFGDSFQLNLVILNAKDATLLASYSGRADNERELTELMENAARATAGEVGKKLGRSTVAWRLNTLTTSPGALLVRRVGIAYERVLSPRFALLVEPEFAYENQVTTELGAVKGTALTIAAGVRWYWFAHAPQGFFSSFNLSVLTGYLTNANLTVGELGAGPRAELGYQWVFFSRMTLTLAAGLEAIFIGATLGNTRTVFATKISPVSRLGLGIAF